MTSHPTKLAESLASLRHAATATQAPAWLPATLHALILACLSRLFGRLEHMAQLWHAGLLPPLHQPTHRTPAPRIPAHATRPASRRRHIRRQTTRRHNCARTSPPRPATWHPPSGTPAILRPPPAITASPTPAARAPPAAKNAARHGRTATSNSLRYQNI